jgi:hypothetical protein
MKMSESSRMLRRRAIRNSARVNALRAATVDRANLVNRVSRVNRESLANRAAAIGQAVVLIAATVEALAIAHRAIMIARNGAANAAVAAIGVIVEIAANVRVNALRWIVAVTVDRAMIVAPAAATVIADRAIQIATVEIAAVLVKNAVVDAIMIVRVKIADPATMTVLPLVAAANGTMTVRRNGAIAEVTRIATIHHAVNQCATILRAVVIPAAAEAGSPPRAARRVKQITQSGLRPAFFMRIEWQPGEPQLEPHLLPGLIAAPSVPAEMRP